VLLTATQDDALVRVRFANSVRGKVAAHGKKAALAFVLNGSMGANTGVAAIDAATPTTLTLGSATCFDTSGNAIGTPAVTLRF